MLKKHLKIYWIIITVLLPFSLSAQTDEILCSKTGYLIETINGIFTKEGAFGGTDGAEGNRAAVAKLVPPVYRGETLTVKYLYNPTHGLLDLTDVAIQKTFDGVDMQDPDFLKILNDASTQVKTQKLLLVAHSQGNFYANNFYNTVTTNGDISPKSIGVYGVGSPSKEVVGSGEYLTSSTDTVINKVRKVLPGTVLKANDWIEYKETDDSGRGHGFREIYLNYRGEEIKKGIEESLAKLSVDSNRSENSSCISTKKQLSKLEKATHVVDYSAKLTISIGATAVTARNNAIIDEVIRKSPSTIFAVFNAYHTAVTVAVWGYDTTLAVGKSAWGIASTIGSFAHNALAGISPNNSIVNNNTASVILATLPPQDLLIVNTDNNDNTVIVTTVPVKNQPDVIAEPPLPPQTVIVFEPKVSETADAPKLVFIGSFELGASGGSPTPREKQILGVATGASEALIEKEVAKEEEVITGAALSAPVLSSPQCTQTLATDGCLLATTTVRFEWPAVTDANHYAINKNGAYATTTDTTFDIPVRDFSEYTFEVASVDSNGTSSATSTKKVSVATIPLAINEIAWAGTNASSNDEWFEIKNNTAHTIDLSQWELNAKNSTPHIKLGGTIAPHAYLVFERTNDEVIKDVVAHQTYSGALGNKGEQLNLSYASTTLDQTPDGAWVGGSNGEMAARATMERYSSKEIGTDSSNWGTNLEYIKNGTDADENHINGTPGAQNSVSTLINKGQDITADFTITADEERYVVDKGGVWVHASTTLTIEPGVTISFYSTNSYDSEFFVEGVIDAKGTAAEPIILNSFLGNQTGGIWIDTATGTSTFDHVHFENIGDVGVFDSSVEVRNSEFVHTGGVDAYGGSSLLIENSNLDNLTRDAIGVYGESDVLIASSTITNQRDGDAIGVYTGSSLTVASTTIDGVHNGDGIGVYESTVAVSSSTIKNVSDDGLGLYEATSTISNTVITSGGENGIGVYEGSATIIDTSVSDFAGSGIVVSAPVESVTIEGGEVTGNSIGVSMDAGSAVLTGVSVHDNGMSETDNVVVW